MLRVLLEVLLLIGYCCLSLIRELWTPLPGKTLKDLTMSPNYPEKPSTYYIIDKFSSPREKGSKYGQRIYGYFLPPESGSYMFAASCSDECKLLLSKTDEERKKEEIINHPRDGPKDMSSEYVTLQGGRTYFIEAQSIQNEWVSPMKVGVRLPSGKVYVPIPKEFIRLSRAGLVDEIFDKVGGATVKDLINDPDFPEVPARGKPLSEFGVTEFDSGDNVGHHISGYFLATETGKYKFFGACSNGCKLYLSKDDTCNKRSLVLDYRSAVEDPRFEVSKTVDLKAGLFYYIEALQTVTGGRRNSIKIGVVMPSGKSSFPIKKDLLRQFHPSKHGVIREVWTNIKGEDIRDLTSASGYPDIPSSIDLLSDFDAPYNQRYNYGQRLRSYFVAPMTGDYRFVMSCDKQCELWLSSTENPKRKENLLKETHATARNQFTKYPAEQMSRQVHLDIGQQYYIEALHKIGTGLDHMTVGVTLPNGVKEWPIPRKYLRYRPLDDQNVNTRSSPCTFTKDEKPTPSPSQNPENKVQNKTKNLNQSISDEQKARKQPIGIVHSWDDVHKPYSEGEVGRFKGTKTDGELELELGPEQSHKMLHDLGSKTAETENVGGPTIDLDEGMAAPGDDDDNSNEESKLSPVLEALIKQGGTEGAKDSKEPADSEGLEDLLLKAKQKETAGKVFHIRLPLDKGVSFLEKIKQFANLHLHHNYHPNQDQVSKLPDFDGVEALNNLGLGQDTESEHLAQMPAEDADKFMNQLNKPPPKDDDEEEVENFKVEGGGSDSLHVIEKNPLASFLKGVKGLGKQHHEPEGPMPLGAIHSHHTHPADLAGVTHRPEIFTQDESVTVVGNTAEMSKLEEEDTAKAQMNGELPGTANDLQLGIGRPINPEEKQNSLGQNILPSTAKIAKYLPINKVTDFDILDLDLVGLKSLANTGAGQMRHKMRKPKNSNYYTSFAAPLNIGSSSITGTGEASSETGDSIDTGQASFDEAVIGDSFASLVPTSSEFDTQFYKRGSQRNGSLIAGRTTRQGNSHNDPRAGQLQSTNIRRKDKKSSVRYHVVIPTVHYTDILWKRTMAHQHNNEDQEIHQVNKDGHGERRQPKHFRRNQEPGITETRSYKGSSRRNQQKLKKEKKRYKLIRKHGQHFKLHHRNKPSQKLKLSQFNDVNGVSRSYINRHLNSTSEELIAQDLLESEEDEEALERKSSSNLLKNIADEVRLVDDAIIPHPRLFINREPHRNSLYDDSRVKHQKVVT